MATANREIGVPGVMGDGGVGDFRFSILEWGRMCNPFRVEGVWGLLPGAALVPALRDLLCPRL
jgi:hypothetical protein